MTDNHLPQSELDPELLEYLGAVSEIDYTRRFAIFQRPERVNLIDDRDFSLTFQPTYKYGNKLVLNEQGVYLLNRLFRYFKDNAGVSHIGTWHHVETMIKTYPMLEELWEQFEVALVLCSEHIDPNKGRL